MSGSHIITPCFECGSEAQQYHHVIPRSLGGTKTIPLCERCHGLVHDNDLRIGALTKNAMQHKASKGEYTGGEPPFGFQVGADGVHLEPNPTEQEVIANVRGLREEGLSLRAIAVKLKSAGIMGRSGKPFAHSQVAKLLEAA